MHFHFGVKIGENSYDLDEKVISALQVGCQVPQIEAHN